MRYPYTLKFLALSACVAGLVACGSDRTSSVENEEEAEQTSGIATVAAGEQMPNCEKGNSGGLVFVQDSAAVYYCANGKWNALKGIDGKDGADGEKGEAGVNGENGKNGENGINGEKGETGAKGETGDKGADGTNCTAKTVTDGIEITCDGVVIDTLENGKNGAAGKSCSATQNTEKSTTTISCEGDDGTSVSYEIKNGENGKSAYELSGSELTLEKWLESLKGEKGASCATKDNGDGSYTISCEGSTPVTIKNGENGKSAYELSGTSLTLEKWLESLKGEKGASCATTDNGDGSYTISCEGSTPVTIKNGEPGTSCTAEEYTDEATERTGYKIICGGEVKGIVWNGIDDASIFFGVKTNGFYKKNCPTGKTCSYVTTEYLNSSKIYGEFLDTRDYQVYKTIEICDENNENCQTWMAQNLNYAYKGVKYKYESEGTTYTSDSTSWCGGGSGTTAGDCSVYGRLYTWAAAMDSADVNSAGKGCGYGTTCTVSGTVRGVCPSGWHLPTNAEWSTLYTNVGGTSTAGTKLKASSSLWTTSSGVTNDDTYGFSVLPASRRGYDGDFGIQGSYAYFWSSTEDNDRSAWYQYFYSSYDYVYQNAYNKYDGRSVRCLKD